MERLQFLSRVPTQTMPIDKCLYCSLSNVILRYKKCFSLFFNQLLRQKQCQWTNIYIARLTNTHLRYKKCYSHTAKHVIALNNKFDSFKSMTSIYGNPQISILIKKTRCGIKKYFITLLLSNEGTLW